ncbi:histidine kinase [Cupriavidus gilardii]|uniref:exopolysaccharide Pel transporter PelG n=1 Tax=Cupriavidus gilardii TaxID=82541 RepID=UPI001EE55511|nr:exopolysaccharide Pel transporter PelG [Cupriavidus gilardii]MCG5258856.1 exopolysaccharide Pel transporter PelG [Cupriavidus gilardii]MDF9429018.1 histidine kinase [Cupriavidus gilardii]
MVDLTFFLRGMRDRNRVGGTLQAYGFASVLACSAWVLAIVGILLIGVLRLPIGLPLALAAQFQVSATYLIAVSLILTGPLQLQLVRFAADRLAEGRDERVLPGFHAVGLVVTVLAGLFGVVCSLWAFPQLSALYRALMLAALVLMCHVWIAVAFLSGMKQYRTVVCAFVAGYAAAALAALALRGLGLEGLLGGLVIGELVLLAGTTMQIHRHYRGRRLLSFEVFARRHRYPSLMAIGLLYPLGIWADKFQFWYHAGTGERVIGALRASAIYDIPVFLAYLAIVPAMAVFLVRIERDFVAHYDAFAEAVRGGGSLQRIEEARNAMVRAVRLGLYEIVKVLAIAALLLFALGRPLLALFGMASLYLPLLHVDVVGAGLYLVLLAALSLYFYLDRRREVLLLGAVFAMLNVGLTQLTLTLGPAWYGYGFAVAALIVVAIALVLLDRRLERLEYETYMLQ